MANPHENSFISIAPGSARIWLWTGMSVLLLASLLLAFSPNYRWNVHKGESPYGSDFLQDWTGANMLVSGHANQLFDAASFDAWQHDPQRIGFTWNADQFYPTVYPPPYYLLLCPLGLLDYRLAVVVWLGILLIALCAAIMIVERLREGKGASRGSRWYWPAMLLFPPVLLSLAMGQKGTLWLLVFAVTWGLMQRQRPLTAGLVFGLLSVKPTLFFFLPLVMLYHRQWRFVWGAGMSWIGLWGVAAAVLPGHVWGEFLEVARGAGNYHQNAGYQLNWSCNLLSLTAGLEKIWLPAWANYLLLGLLASYVVSLACFANRWVQQERFDLRQGRHLGGAIVATCLLSPHFYVYDLVVLLLPIRLLWATHRTQAVLLLLLSWVGVLASQLFQAALGLPLMPLVLLGSLYCLSTVTVHAVVRSGDCDSSTHTNVLHGILPGHAG
ncbi:MAG: glycosyltransferase family 87 protein [Pirellulaceae bacterium]